MLCLMENFLLYFVAGGLGSFVHLIVSDGKLQMPYFHDGYIVLGFLGGIIIGGFVGYAVDQNFLSAAMGGYVGISALTKILPPTSNKQ